MAWAIVGCDVTIIFGFLILIPYHHRDRSTSGFSFEYTRKDFYSVTFFSWCCKLGLARFSSVQENLDVIFAQRKTSWAAVYYHTESFSMRFAPSGYSKQFSKCRSSHICYTRFLYIKISIITS